MDQVSSYLTGLGDLHVVFLVIGYCLCSSLLSVVNKAAITVFPFPSLLTGFQYFVSVVAVFFLGLFGVLEHDPLMWDMILKYLPAAIVFYLAIFTNTNLLKYANLDTFIVFRSSTPLIVAIADTVFRKQPIPSLYTFGSLVMILMGAIGYVATDYQFSVVAYSWAVAYTAVITFEMVYVKHIVHNLGLSTWGFVYYNNFLSLVLTPLFLLSTGESQEIDFDDIVSYLQPWTLFPVIGSCIFGLAISFFGFATRKAISATSFTVLGVTNKLLTVVVNISIWDKHASPVGIFCLLITIFGGVLYQQSLVGVKAPQEVTKTVSTPHKIPKSPQDDKTLGASEEESEALIGSEEKIELGSVSVKRTSMKTDVENGSGAEK